MSAIRFGTWNARNVINKKEQVESLLHNLDILAISESWLSPCCPVWQVAGYFMYRKDRLDQRVGSGSHLLVGNSLEVAPILLNAGVTSRIDAVGAVVDTHLGRIQFLSVYASPGVAIPGGT